MFWNESLLKVENDTSQNSVMANLATKTLKIYMTVGW